MSISQSHSGTPSVLLMSPGEPPAAFQAATREDGWALAVARAIVSSPAWHASGASVLVVRREPSVIFGILGHLGPAARRRFEGLRWQLEHALPHLRYVSYPEVERAVFRLAKAIEVRIGDAGISESHFAAIPRGGHVVLGMLSYALELDQEQLEARPDARRPTVLVDDVALSGNRLKRYLEARPEKDIAVFAPLLATPELRAAIELDPRVTTCVSGDDLDDLAPGLEGKGHRAWLERWRDRQGDGAYWIGQPEHACFPWSEPDIALWNEHEHVTEPGWRLVPPELCLKHRPVTGHDATRGNTNDAIQVQPDGAGTLRPAADVLFARLNGSVVLASPRWGSGLALEGVAAAMWEELVRAGSERVAARSVAERYGTDPATVASDLGAFVSSLLERRALERRANSAPRTWARP